MLTDQRWSFLLGVLIGCLFGAVATLWMLRASPASQHASRDSGQPGAARTAARDLPLLSAMSWVLIVSLATVSAALIVSGWSYVL